MLAVNSPQVGVEYSYDAVAAFYDHDPVAVHFVIVKGREIKALRLREDYNPNITSTPAEVWVGAFGEVKTWGNVLASLKNKRPVTKVPVFAKAPNSNNYRYLGKYIVIDREFTTSELDAARTRMTSVHDQGVSRIVYLTAS